MTIQGRNRVQGRRPCVFFLVFWCGWWWIQVYGFITYTISQRKDVYTWYYAHISAYKNKTIWL